MFKYTLILAIALFSTAYAGESTHHGYGTAYSGPFDMDATGQNMCEFNPSSLNRQWQVYYAAMNQKDWNDMGGKDSICGRCIAIRGVPGETTDGFKIKTVIAKIVDQCPDWACDEGNVDFSTTALKAVTGYSWDKKKITWEYVDCNTDPNDDSARSLGPSQSSSAEKAAAKAAAKAKAAASLKAAEAAKAAALAKDEIAQATEDAESADDRSSAQMAASKRAAEAQDAADAALAAKKAYAKIAAQKESRARALASKRKSSGKRSSNRRRNNEVVATRDASRSGAVTEPVSKPTRDARRKGQEIKPRSTRDANRSVGAPASPKPTRDASRKAIGGF